MCESQLLTKLCQLQTSKGQHNGHSHTSSVLSRISTGALRHSNYVLAIYQARLGITLSLLFVVLATKFQNLVQKKKSARHGASARSSGQRDRVWFTYQVYLISVFPFRVSTTTPSVFDGWIMMTQVAFKMGAEVRNIPSFQCRESISLEARAYD